MTREDYDAKLEVLVRVIPGNPLLPRLRAGFSATNARYVDMLMAENVAPEPKRRTRLVTEPTTTEPTGPEWAALSHRKSNLYQQRGKISNRFHDVDTVDERADISREIRHVQGKIRTVHRQMAYYRVHNTLPEDLSEQEQAVYTEAEAMKARQAINSKMTRLRSNLKQAATTKPERVRKWEAQLKECERERTRINGIIGQLRL